MAVEERSGPGGRAARSLVAGTKRRYLELMHRSATGGLSVGLVLCVLCGGCQRVGFHVAGRRDTSAPPGDARFVADAVADASRPGTDAADASGPGTDAGDASLPDTSAPDTGGGPTAGLLLWLPMADDPSDGVDDVAGGGATAHCSSCPTLAAGAYQFSGSQYVKVDPEPRFQTTTGFTVAIRARPSSMGLFQVMVCKLYGTAVANSWHLSLRQASGCADRFYYETTDGGGYQVLTSEDAVSIDRWWHVASTWDGSTKRLYLDGVLVKSGSNTTLMDSGPIYIGTDWDSGAPAHLFHGALRDFRLYDRALSDAEVAQLAGAVAPPAPPVPGAVTALILVDAATDTDIGPLTSPASVTVPPGGINIRAEVSGAPGSVRFVLDGSPYRVENTAPYSLEGDTNGDYAAWNPTSGLHTVTATPFCGSGATGTMGGTVSLQLDIN